MFMFLNRPVNTVPIVLRTTTTGKTVQLFLQLTTPRVQFTTLSFRSVPTFVPKENLTQLYYFWRDDPTRPSWMLSLTFP